MTKKLIAIVFLLVFTNQMVLAKPSLEQLKRNNELHKGFVSYIFDSDNGKFYLKIDNLNSDFLYQTSLPQGLGSNDIGLDRGQLGETHIARFERSGNKLLLIAKNTKYQEQGYISARDWSDFNDEIKKRWANGYYIIDISEGW